MIVPDAERWKRLSPLLDGLLDLEPAARAARLDALRAEDAPLAGELAALIGDAERAEHARFLAGSVAPASARDDTRDGDASASLVGERIGAYLIDAPLGQGGTGTVWRAHRADGRYQGGVAVKLLHLSLVGRTGALRFEREGGVLARLSHPHIAHLLDAGVTPGGQPFLVLELVEGERIDRHCDAGQLGIAQRVALFRIVLAAVAHAHSHLVIHRDIKPGNILVDRGGQVKLLDFGIAKLMQGEDGAGPAGDLTGDGLRALTPDYAAPEQLRGEAVSTATDVYSLGVLLYQLLTGRHPTVLPNATPADSIRAALDTDPSRLSTAVTVTGDVPAEQIARIAVERDTSPTRLKRQLGGDLENIVAKSLRKLPAERYATVDAFAEDLRRWAAGEPVSARSDSLGYRASKFVGRHRGKVAVAVLTFFAIAAGVVGTVSQAHRAENQALRAEQQTQIAEQQRRRAESERDNALRDLAFSGASRDLLGFLLTQASSTALTSSQLLERAEQMADGQFADDSLTRGRLQFLLAVEYGNLQEYDKSKAVLGRALGSAQRSGNVGLRGNVECLQAATLGDQNQPGPAMNLFEAAIARLRAEAEPETSVLAGCLHMRADLHAHRGEPAAMLADAEAGLKLLGKPRPDQRLMANSLGISAAEAYGRLGQPAKAIAAYEASLAELAAMGRDKTARTGIRYANFSRMLYVSGQALRSADMASRGLAIAKDIGGETELLAILEGNRARALVELGRFAEAQVLTEHALASALQRNDVRWAGTFALYGAPAFCSDGKLERCAALLEIAREKLRAALPAGHSTFASIELLASQLLLARGKVVEARDAAARAVGLFEAAPDKSALQAQALVALARLDVRTDDAAAGTRHADQAVTHATRSLAGLPHSEWLGQALLARAITEPAGANRPAALAQLQSAAENLRETLGADAPSSREAIELAGRR